MHEILRLQANIDAVTLYTSSSGTRNQYRVHHISNFYESRDCFSNPQWPQQDTKDGRKSKQFYYQIMGSSRDLKLCSKFQGIYWQGN
ncbi:unnamed protein product [Fusarium graminearum]|nr:unnamed protein product [Fusarium graminearum]